MTAQTTTIFSEFISREGRRYIHMTTVSGESKFFVVNQPSVNNTHFNVTEDCVLLTENELDVELAAYPFEKKIFKSGLVKRVEYVK